MTSKKHDSKEGDNYEDFADSQNSIPTEVLKRFLHDWGRSVTTMRSHISNINSGLLNAEKTELRLRTVENILDDLIQQMMNARSLVNIVEDAPTRKSFERVHLANLVIEAVRNLQEKAKTNRGLDIIVHGDCKIDSPVVFSNELWLKQIVWVLVDNAITYSYSIYDSTCRDISVNYFVHDNKFGVSVLNQGATIDEDELSHLFDIYYRGKHSSEFSVLGTGVGLYMVKTLTEKLGGKVEVSINQDNVSFSVIFNVPAA